MKYNLSKMSKEAALEIADKRLEEQRDEMDREPLGKTTEQGLSAKKSDRTGEENKNPSLIEKKLSDKPLPTENSKLQGLVEKRLDTASTTPYPHRNPEAWERTGDKRQVNNLEPEQKDASDEKRTERFEKADKAAQEGKRLLDKDIGKQLTNKKAFNLKAIKNSEKYSGYERYLNYKSGSGPFSNRNEKIKDIDDRLKKIMSQRHLLSEAEQKEVSELKATKSGLLGVTTANKWWDTSEGPDDPKSGWNKGEWTCPKCGRMIGKNLRNQPPYALVEKHKKECNKSEVQPQ